MITRLLLAGLVSTLALLGWARYEGVQARNDADRYLALTLVQKDALEGQERALRASRLALAARIKAQARLNKQLKDSNARLSQAIAANKAWADQPLPPGITDWLRERPDRDQDGQGYTP